MRYKYTCCQYLNVKMHVTNTCVLGERMQLYTQVFSPTDLIQFEKGFIMDSHYFCMHFIQ